MPAPGLLASDKEVINETISVKLYPNPTSDYVIIESNMTIHDIEIYNLSGQLVQQVKQNKSERIQLDVSNLTAGLYLVKISNESNMQTIRLSVNN